MVISAAPPRTAPTVTFFGAAQSVTGSMHLVEANGSKLLLDCGLVVGRHAESRHNRQFPFPPHEIDAVVLSHAHIDHCGNLPNLVHQGFRGPIFCTPATRDLLAVMLADSARFQEQGDFVLEVLDQPLQAHFSTSDVKQTLSQCLPIPYDESHEIAAGIDLRLLDAGHILGSAMVALIISGPGADYRIAFTGDVGRRGLPLLHDPVPLPESDLVLSESTYGGRFHEPFAETVEALRAAVRQTIERRGTVLIPSFSLGRTQIVVHVLEAEMRAGRIPSVPVFVDSRLSADVADVYLRHAECLRDPPAEEADLLEGPGVTYLRSLEESRQLSERREPCVIVASGGMCEGGRSLHHLKQMIDDPRCSILLVSYQAAHTLGRRLLERGPTVRFHGKKWNKWAEIVELSGFSGHADHNDLVALLKPLAGQAKVCLVHGDPIHAEVLAQALRAEGFADVVLPAREEQVSVA